MNDSIIHTLQNCSWTILFSSEVIKWFNAENATSLSFSRIEIMFGRTVSNKKKCRAISRKKAQLHPIVCKVLFIQHQAKSWGDFGIDFIAKVSHKYSLDGLNVWGCRLGKCSVIGRKL